VIYEWECVECGAVREVVSSIAHRNAVEYCGDGHDVSAMHRIITRAPIAIADIAPYQAVAGDRAGQFITSRSEHREFLKRNRLVEVGDAPIRSTKQMRQMTPTRDYRERRRADLREALRAHVPLETLRKTR
jgi:hypothetical protein